MIKDIVNKVKNQEVTVKEVVLEAIKKAEAVQDKNALIKLTKESALKKAEELDKKIKAGNKEGKLLGVPYVVKDNFLTLLDETTAASKMLEDFKAPLEATVIKKLEAEGAIYIGKSNLDAFAHGGSTENSFFGVTKNAFDNERVAGGSSGGSAVITALDVVPFALGSDTGGSIRQPASFNGVFGVKPTYGTVSRFGVVAMASSTDTIGCFSKTVEDSEIVMEIISGKDKKDMTTLDDFFKIETEPPKNKKIAIIKDFMTDAVDPEVLKITNDYIDRLKQAGHEVEEVSMPILKYTLAIYYVLIPAEVSSNLARYDGIRYGFRAESNSLDELYGKSRDQGFMPENKRRILIGSFVLSSGFFDAYYLKAQKARTLLKQAFDDVLGKYDALIGPVSPTPAFKIGENTDDPIKMYLADIMTVPASLVGLPAMSVPAGKTSLGLPVNVQLIGKAKDDAKLMALAKSVEIQ
ncbi:Asp-tRNA(Asn)/Glu-tRNA(Gln) amidotransferase subunit GatA [TM7 phylum sp. oral taxon 350]|nr:Asp-tRNA(Asn)/Glu-tRNA(Gln) amidotransferase subunit GatA [TM7 phylum sp. oral taxon 350]